MPTSYDGERVARFAVASEKVAAMNIADDCGGKDGCRGCPGCDERHRIFLEAGNEKCDAAVKLFKDGGARIDAIEAMTDRPWGADVAPQWSDVLGDRETGEDQIIRTKFGFDLNLSQAASYTCACESEVGIVMLWFDRDIFLSIAQSNLDGRGDASLLRFDRAEIEAAVAKNHVHPRLWFPEGCKPRHPYDLLLPTEYEGIPSQKKRERSFGWHLVAYEELIARHAPLIAATLMEDCNYASSYGAAVHPLYGFPDPTNGNEVCFNLTKGHETGQARDASSCIPPRPTNGVALDWKDLNDHHARGAVALMEVFWRNYHELYLDFQDQGIRVMGGGEHVGPRKIQPTFAHEYGFERCPAGALSKGRTDLLRFHASFRALVQRGHATVGRSTRGKARQAVYQFLYRDSPTDVFKLIVTAAVPTPEKPPSLDPNTSVLTGGRQSDGGGCAIM